MVNKELLKELREKYQYSYRGLARKIDSNKRRVVEFETGKSIPTEEELLKLADLYHMQIDELLLKEEKEERKPMLKIIILVIISILVGLMLKEMLFIILIPIFSLLLIANKLELSHYRKEEGEKPKSLFGYALEEKNKKMLFFESNIVACCYVLFTFLFRLIHFDFLVLEVDLFESELLNQLFVIGGSYVLLLTLCFLIEVIFAKLMKKKMEDVWI